jgi:hypothetical protein
MEFFLDSIKMQSSFEKVKVKSSIDIAKWKPPHR